MNILMVSLPFYPSVGGIEAMTENLANEFVRKGHRVTVITRTPGHEAMNKEFAFNVLRNPSVLVIYKAYKECDVFVHQVISLKYIWPLFWVKRPFFVVYHQVGWVSGVRSKLKRLISNFSNNICVSRTTANGYNLKSYNIIYNAYNDAVFKQSNNGKRKDIAFVGHPNRNKGAYLLIDAFTEFKSQTNSDYKLNFIGDDPEREAVEKYAVQTKYASDIIFLGYMSPMQISKTLNDIHIMVVPSTRPYYEAFGIVVLEGLACGCTVIGADGDGIEEALHSAGILYKNGNSAALCSALIKAVQMSEEERKVKSIMAEEWLNKRKLSNVADEYIKLFEESL